VPGALRRLLVRPEIENQIRLRHVQSCSRSRVEMSSAAAKS
jgi:hypothetical protein